MSDLTRVYELGYLLLPTLGDEGSAQKAEAIKKFVLDLGAEEIAEGSLERIDLAYPMVKVIDNKNVRFVEGYFGWLKFALDADLLAKVKEFIANDSDTIRHLLFKTVRENTFLVRKGTRRKKKLEEATLEEAAEEVPEKVDEAPSEEEPTESEVLDTKIDTLIPDSE